MQFNLIINEIKSIHDLPGYWTNEDYINLLEAFNFTDANNSDPSELRQLLEMAINDFEPEEAAEIILRYKLSEKLNEGQIKNLSNEMVEGNESEEYPDIALHFPIFNINQLLYKAFNGVFTNAKATKIDIELNVKDKGNILVTSEILLKAMSKVLNNHNLIIRLYEEQLNGEKEFVDAEKIIWVLEKTGEKTYRFITSDYWINKEDINESEANGIINFYDEA